MRISGGAGASLRRLRDASPGALHPVTTLLFVLLLLCSLVAVDSASETREWRVQPPLESHVTVSADGLAASRGVGRRRSDGLSITRSLPMETSIASEGAVDDQAIKFTPTRVDLGRMETCSPQRYSVGVENRGRVSVRLDGADFTHVGFSLANDVRGIRLDPGDRFNVQFVFLPREVEPNGVDAHLRVLTTSGLFALPIRSPEVALNRYGVSAVRASIPAGVRYEQSLQLVNPLDYTIRITEMYALDDFVHLELFNGSEWIGPRWPRESDNEEVAQEVRGEYDEDFDYTRRAHRGAWDMPAGSTNPLIKVSLHTYTPGVYFTYIHIAAGERRLLLVPVHITVLKPGIHIEPKELDLGVLTDDYENEPLELYFSLYNTGLNPIEVLELKVLESNMIVSAQLRGSTTIPPQTRVYHALAVQLRVNKAYAGGDCIASLLLKSNASSSELGQRRLRLYGQVVKGYLSFQLNETLMEAITPLDNVFRCDEDIEDWHEKTGAEQDEEDQEAPNINLISMTQNGSLGILAGTSEFRQLRLWNLFNRPVELQHMWVLSTLPEQNELPEVTVHKFKQSVVPVGAAWPKISLQITPALHGQGNFLAPRIYSLMVETNATLHQIQIHVYHSILSVKSSRGLQSYSISGYHNSTTQQQGPTQACSFVPRDGVVSSVTPRIDGGKGPAVTQAVQICRSMLFDLGKLASHRARTEVVEVLNENPVPLVVRIANTPQSQTVQISIRAEVLSDDHVDSVMDPVSDYTNDTTVGDIFVLKPNYRVNFHVHVEVQAKDTLGKITVPAFSISTAVEVLHLYARFRSVQGTVEPVTPAIILPSMFPGRTEVLHLRYRNTFKHLVTPLFAFTSSPNVKLLSMSDAMAPQQVENVLDLLFSPAADSKCSDATFLADCLLPLPPAPDEQTCEKLSDYGEFVTANDLAALRRRDAFWSETQNYSTVEAQVQLQTDIMEDVANVTITALMERPFVTVQPDRPVAVVAPVIPAHPGNGSFKDLEPHRFALTELLHLSQVVVHVRNPSNISIQMELTIAVDDQEIFYPCDLESRAREALEPEGGESKNAKDISALCLAEWGVLASEASVLRGKHIDVDAVPPFYFQRKIVRVPAGKEAQLGPIYYFPSNVQKIATTMFVRNDLSHIEPVSLLARSGKGTLALVVDAGAGNSKSTNTHFAAMGSVGSEQDDITANSERKSCDGKLSFALTEDDAPTQYSQSANISLSNTGPFGLTVRSVAIKGEGDVSWLSSTRKSNASEFVLLSEHLGETESDSKQGEKGDTSLVLPPGKSAHYEVLFRSSCFAASTTSWLIVDTSDSVKRIRLQGSITTDAAFACLRSRMPTPFRYAVDAAWLLAVAAAAMSTLYTLLIMVHDAWTFDDRNAAQAVHLAVHSDTLVAETEHQDAATPTTEESDKVPPPSLQSIHHVLEKMEQAAFAPPARVVTPAVAALLERRHKGLCSPAPPPGEGVQPSKTEETRRHEKGEETSAPVTKMEASDSKEAPSTVKTKKILRTDSIPTAADSGLNNAQEAMHDDALLPLTGKHSAQLVEAKYDVKANELSSSEDESDVSPEASPSSASSSHSTIVQTEVEESRTAFPNLMFGSPGDEFMPAVGPTLSTTTPQQKQDGPFEAFKSLSERWRAQDWQDNLTDPSPPSLSGTFLSMDGWDGALSLGQNSLGTTGGNQGSEGALSGRHSDSSFGRAGSGLNLDGFSTFAAPLPTVEAATKKAPPGFTPADAKPLETRAAFERLRDGEMSASSRSDSFSGSTLFASKLPLFGPTLPPSSGNHAILGGVGRIGSGRLKGLRGVDAPLEAAALEDDDGQRRMKLGGRGL